MFIEQLKEKDVQTLVKRVLGKKKYRVYQTKYFENSKLWGVDVRFENTTFKGQEIKELVVFGDFHLEMGKADSPLCKINPSTIYWNHEVEHMFETFKAFMLKKFGDEYKQAFNENLKQKYESEMIK